jgi:hypothetical protein
LERPTASREFLTWRLAKRSQRVEGRGKATIGAGLDHGFDDLRAAEPDIQRRLAEFRRLDVELQGGERGDRDQSAVYRTASGQDLGNKRAIDDVPQFFGRN